VPTYRDPTKFIAARTFTAIYRTRSGEQPLLFEVRRQFEDQLLLFSIINGEAVRMKSVQDFILKRLECLSLSIPHHIPMQWQGVRKQAELVETFSRSENTNKPILLRLKLTVENKTFEAEGDCLTEAIFELIEAIGPQIDWYLGTCYHCNYFGAFDAGPGEDDREDLRCYRDAPHEQFLEVKKRAKFASLEAHCSGHYFVDAFHTCPAWTPNSVGPKYEGP